jgi:DNA ligase-1
LQNLSIDIIWIGNQSKRKTHLKEIKMIKQIIEEIANESSTNLKMEILKKYVDNETLKQVLYLAYSPRIKFYIKQIPDYHSRLDSSTLRLTDVITNLNMLFERKITGGEAIDWLKNILSSLDSDDSFILQRIIEKDLKMGMGSTNVNKVFKGLIEQTPYMGCRPYSPELAHKLFLNGNQALSEVKADGRYCNAIVRGQEVELVSRQGEATYLYNAHLINDLKKIDGDMVFNGELVIPNINRQTSNGIIASCIDISEKLNNDDLDGATKSIDKLKKKHSVNFYDIIHDIKYIVWDVISVEEYFNELSNTKRIDRLNNLKNIIETSSFDNIELVEYKIVNSFEEAIEHLNEILERGDEGTVLKSLIGLWKDGKHPWAIKLKLEIDLDLKIIDFNFGSKGTKNEFVISSINVESSDGILKTSCQGLTEQDMEYVTKNQSDLIGKIVKVKCNGLSNNRNGGQSVMYPTYIEIRNDKTDADSFEQCKLIEAMAKGLTI